MMARCKRLVFLAAFLGLIVPVGCGSADRNHR